jgi:streptogramin lyase
VTDGSGEYVITGILAGTHRVTAHGIGYEAVSHDGLDFADDHRNLNFTISRVESVADQVPSSSILNVFPDGVEKRKLIVDCMGCHQFNQPIIYDSLGALRGEGEWAASVNKMISFCGPQTFFPILPPDRTAEPTAKWVARYLTAQRLAEHVDTPPGRNSAPVTITEYDLPVQQDFPHDLMIDPEGNIVVTGMFSAEMYVLDPDNGEFTTRKIPMEFANPRALDIDANGDWWIALGMPRKIAHYSQAADEWRFHDIGVYPHSVMLDGKGNIWFNGHFSKDPELIGSLAFSDKTVATFEVPPGVMTAEEGGPIPYGLRVAPDGVVWGTELAGNRLIKFETEDGTFTVYEMPESHSGPRRLDVGPDGMVWIPEFATGKLARFDPKTETFVEHGFPTPNSLPYCARVDQTSGIVWISQAANDAIARFDPKTETFSEYRLPSKIAFIRHLDVDPGSGEVWGAYSQSPGVHPRIVRLRTE